MTKKNYISESVDNYTDSLWPGNINIVDTDITYTYTSTSTSFDLYNNNIIEYLKFICDLLEIDIPDYNDFLNMTQDEIKAYIREKKINKLLQE